MSLIGKTSNNCLILAGEPSGEEHVQSFFPRLKELCSDIHFWGVGGDWMKAQEVELLYHLKDFSSMGFSEVIGKIPFYFKALKRLEEECVRRRCQWAILVDFQDFNLRLAKRLAKKGVHVLYYVAPQAWAWKPYRAHVLARTVHTLFTMVPFEKEWFTKRGVSRVFSIEHPLHRRLKKDWVDPETKKMTPSQGLSSWQGKTVVILPGSRRQEVKTHLPVFSEVARTLRKDYGLRPILVQAAHIDESLFAPFLKDFDDIYSENELGKALADSHLALATSGTVTLATGYYALPTVVCYATDLFNEWVFRSFINYEGHISLTNLFLESEVYPELIQESFSPFNVLRETRRWLEDVTLYNETLEKLKRIKEMLSHHDGDVSEYMAAHLRQEV